MTLSAELVRHLFEYRDGWLYRKVQQGPARVGDRAGGKDGRGYLQIRVQNRKQLAHRLIFLWHSGWLPREVDHIDGNKTNNRIENLRAATAFQNHQNSRRPQNSTSGVKGVYWDKQSHKWRARCRVDGVQHNVGYFGSLSDAAQAVRRFRQQHHGEFARHA